MAAHFCVFLFLYFYFCIFVKKGESCYLPQLTSLHRSLSLRPDSESKLWVESTAGRRRSTHLNWFFYFTFLRAELFLCESLSRQTPSLFCLSEVKAAKPSSDPFPALNHQFWISQNLKCSFSLWPEILFRDTFLSTQICSLHPNIFSPPKYALQSNLTFHRFTSL